MKKLVLMISTVMLLIFLSSMALARDYHYIVGKGDCLSVIGQKFGLKWREIAKANNVKGPKYIIYPGQKLFLYSAEAVKTTTGEEKKTVLTEKPDVTISNKKTTSVSKKNRDSFDAYMNMGVYKSHGGSKDNRGKWISAKVRIRPYQTKIKGKKVGVGFFGRYEIGSGKASGVSANGKPWHSDYNLRTFAIGPSAKVNGKYWESTTDIGIGRFWSDNNKGTEQTDNILYFSESFLTDKRKKQGKKFFPTTEVFFSAIVPFDSNRHDASGNDLRAYNRERVDLTLIQEIYDFKLNNKKTKITPNFQIGTGFETGHVVGKIGAGFKIRDNGQEILAFSVGPKVKDGASGFTWLINATISVGGAIKAYRASQIKSATADDITARIAKEKPKPVVLASSLVD